uniref:Transcription termination factor 3, mitochondrial n=1 Tax=Noccaea caerulescens TaxID=107243 RepID=A0A1J3IEF1_NOCCA
MYPLIRHGRKLIELQKCRNFVRFSVNPLQNSSAFSNSSLSSAYDTDSSSQDGRKGHAFTVSYLVDSLGLTKKLAESISKKVTFEEKRNPDSILNLLRIHGFTGSQISSIVTDYPRLFLLDPEKSLAPKLRFLQSRGASSSELTEIVSEVPEILGKDRSFSVYYDFVKEVIQADKSSSLEKLCHSLAQGSKQENKIRNLSVLRELGMPQQLLFPLLISNSPHVCGKEKFEESLKKVVELGFDPRTSKFVEALRIVYTLKKETMEEKVNVYKRLGFDEGDVWEMFKKWPISLSHSEKKIKQKFETLMKCGLVEDEVRLVCKKFPQVIGVSEEKIESSIETFLGIGLSRDEFAVMVKRYPACVGLARDTVMKKAEFLVKKMNWRLKELVSNSQVVGYSMEKRIVPRCNVIEALLSRGLLGSGVPSLSSVLVCTDQSFLNKYVRKHDDEQLVLELMDVFTGETRT